MYASVAKKHTFFLISSDTTHVLTNLGAEALQQGGQNWILLK
jgi:hypothetical protein